MFCPNCGAELFNMQTRKSAPSAEYGSRAPRAPVGMNKGPRVEGEEIKSTGIAAIASFIIPGLRANLLWCDWSGNHDFDWLYHRMFDDPYCYRDYNCPDRMGLEYLRCVHNGKKRSMPGSIHNLIFRGLAPVGVRKTDLTSFAGKVTVGVSIAIVNWLLSL